MTSLYTCELELDSAEFNGESCLPPIATKLSLGDISNDFSLDENDGLFINYGSVESAYPYRMQDLYDRELKAKKHTAVILENEHLKATFMPTFGGKLWSLFDKDRQCELLFENSVVRPCNLAVRNAWMSGGIEWNSGFRGHHPFTCLPVNTAKTHLPDGTPVLRFYYFERIRASVVQMDFFLPEDSKALFARVRITNPGNEVIPMYWWSNVAVSYGEGDRVIAPAAQSYTAPDGRVVKIDIPNHNGIDVSYPYKNIASNDYFWKTFADRRHYIAKLDREGYGLCQTSTSLLKGRKMFVWGNSQGGSKWMNFLTADNESGTYAEIQCGLAHTQYECLPMPPHTVWEWMEAYAPMQADKTAVHGDWSEAQAEVENQLSLLVSQEALEQLLNSTRGMAKSKCDSTILEMNDGWGALELFRKSKLGDEIGLMNPHLDFGKLTDEQLDWVSLCEKGTVGVHDGSEVPASYMRQSQWVAMLREAVENRDKDNWYAFYLLGTECVAEESYEEAERLLKRSVELCPTAWGYYALGVCRQKTNKAQEAAELMLKAYSLRPHDLSLAKELFRSLFECEGSEQTVEIFESETENIRENKRILLYYAYALARLGRLDEAEEIICGKDGKSFLVVPDIRECELTITKLWVFINEQRGMTRSQMGEPPYDLDFRMFAAREGWF